eukprot:TRINITY_DN20200_c0_g2_i2.p1 TRINITY_DN20200_c0_g2~~TRINITY_DN20200_c0_g2_i2.p1  ORF type:complete len:224 (+),score=46.16 TRINITY_DN20200_c0_g2_i2:1284-1955(+)
MHPSSATNTYSFLWNGSIGHNLTSLSLIDLSSELLNGPINRQCLVNLIDLRLTFWYKGRWIAPVQYFLQIVGQLKFLQLKFNLDNWWARGADPVDFNVFLSWCPASDTLTELEFLDWDKNLETEKHQSFEHALLLAKNIVHKFPSTHTFRVRSKGSSFLDRSENRKATVLAASLVHAEQTILRNLAPARSKKRRRKVAFVEDESSTQSGDEGVSQTQLKSRRR